jgi:hypothetical protein
MAFAFRRARHRAAVNSATLGRRRTSRTIIIDVECFMTDAAAAAFSNWVFVESRG